jgi:hypothetical protein
MMSKTLFQKNTQNLANKKVFGFHELKFLDLLMQILKVCIKIPISY